MTFTEIPKPTTTYSEAVEIAQNFLLINSSNFLLINSSGDRLLINNLREGNYTDIQKPSTSYSDIPKPL